MSSLTPSTKDRDIRGSEDVSAKRYKVQGEDIHVGREPVARRTMGDSGDLPLPPLVSQLPGLNEPLDYVPPQTILLPNPLILVDDYRVQPDSRCFLPLTTIREFRMLQFMNEVTDKDNWHEKIMDDDIANKWMREVQEQQPDGHFTDRMARYCLAELRWKATQYEKMGGLVFVYNGDVVKSDMAISAELRSRLRVAVGKLESSIVKKDYHPNSEEKVWDLVHPSLFPLVYGKSRVLRDQVVGRDDCVKYIACGEVIPEPASVSSEYSRKFQWLPCDVHLSVTRHNGDDGSMSTTTTTCQITSYVNNLHPQRHADLYAVLEDIIAAAIPLWNASLQLAFAPVKERHPLHYYRYEDEDKRRPKQRIIYKVCRYDPNPEELEDFPDADLYREDIEEWDWIHNEWAKKAWLRCLVYPEPDDFQEPHEMAEPMTTNKLVDQFADTGLQVIVKLATIELTPDKPEYGGGVWHLEGQLNEHICATALYYYSTENITESRLGFRQISHNDDHYGITYEQFDHTFLEPIFGCQHEGSSVQDIGSVWCKEGRLLTFPNILQHRVLPFELADKTRPGHRKMLALFLVDPNIHIVSTARVPPQRQDWWDDSSGGGAMARFSPELQQRMLSMVDFPMSTETAESLRLELMEERREFEINKAAAVNGLTKISLCEH